MFKNGILLITIGFIISCGKNTGDILTLQQNSSPNEEETSPTPYLIISGQDGNHRGLTYYSLEGTYIKEIDFRAESGTPRGLVTIDENNILVVVDTNDAIYQVNREAEKTIFHGSAQLNGTVYGLVRRESDGFIYTIESNRIEVFDSNGNRQASHYITDTVGGCVLNSPRDLIINSNGELVVTDAGGTDEILYYDISSPSPSCISTVAFPNDPQGILLHSDGFLYVTTLGDDRVYRLDPDGSNPVVIWDTDISIIRDPTDIIELPNGNLLISSSTTDSIEQLTTAGARVGSEPFIRDSNSLNPASMVIMGGTSE